jgi:Lon-like ATP-dependent protease
MLEPLHNRLEIIEIPAYIEEEKVFHYKLKLINKLAIGRDFMIPKILELNGLKKNLIKYNDETISKIIKGRK